MRKSFFVQSKFLQALYTTPTITNAEDFDELEIESDDDEIQENLENENFEQSDENDEEIDDREDDLDLEGEPDEATFEDESETFGIYFLFFLNEVFVTGFE